MDPPSYGRGPTGEVWKQEDNLYPFVELCAKVLSDQPFSCSSTLTPRDWPPAY